jgi:uncharacterized membrane protein
MPDPHPKSAPSAVQVHKVELALSYLLRAGVIVSMLLVFAGLAVMYTRHPDYFTSQTSAADVTRQMVFPHTIAEVLAGLSHGEGRSIIIAGLFVLIATPVLRVAASVLIFFHLRDRTFALITFVVLALLLLSFLLGRAGG